MPPSCQQRTAATTSAGPWRWTPLSAEPTSTLPEPEKGGTGTRRTRRSRTRTLQRRSEHESPLGQRQPCPAARGSHHRRPGRRRTGLRGRHGRHPRSAERARKTEDSAGCRPGRPCVFIPRDQEPSSSARDPCRHPPTFRPGRPPPPPRSKRRPATRFRRRGIQAAEHRRTMHQPSQAMARPGHANRQARHRLPGRTTPRRHPHLDAAASRPIVDPQSSSSGLNSIAPDHSPTTSICSQSVGVPVPP